MDVNAIRNTLSKHSQIVLKIPTISTVQVFIQDFFYTFGTPENVCFIFFSFLTAICQVRIYSLFLCFFKKSEALYFFSCKPQSQEITQSGNLRAAIVYVIARHFRQGQTPQSAQKFLLPKSLVHYLCHLKSNNIIGERKTTNKENTFIHD